MPPLGGQKRKASAERKDKAFSKGDRCYFCATNPPALTVMLPVIGRKKRAPKPYCLRCYYTTSAVRIDPKHISVLDEDERVKQLPAMQEMFSECYLEIQEELFEESVKAFKKQKSDPLAMLSASSASTFASRKRRKLVVVRGPAPDVDKKKEGKEGDGGFLREIELPERLKKTQQEQRELQNQQLARINKAASAARRASRESTRSANNKTNESALATAVAFSKSVVKRRKGSGKSIWNLAMDKGRDGKLSTVAESYKSENNNKYAQSDVTCACGSKDVQSFGNITSRNQEVRKGEIWGTDRGEDVISRYQCNKCGKTWNETE